MEQKKVYIVPQVTSYTEEEILTELGDAQLMPMPPPVSGDQ